jgi:hypothetical protein
MTDCQPTRLDAEAHVAEFFLDVDLDPIVTPYMEMVDAVELSLSSRLGVDIRVSNVERVVSRRGEITMKVSAHALRASRRVELWNPFR